MSPVQVRSPTLSTIPFDSRSHRAPAKAVRAASLLSILGHHQRVQLQRRHLDVPANAVAPHRQLAALRLEADLLRQGSGQADADAGDRNDLLAQRDLGGWEAVVGRRVHPVEEVYD